MDLPKIGSLCAMNLWPSMDQDWLRGENLLPHQTVEKLTKWAVYDDDARAQRVPAHNGRGPWESEDPTQDMLESRLNSTQVQRDEPIAWTHVGPPSCTGDEWRYPI